MGLNPLSDLFGLGEKLIDKLLPDPKQRADALFKLKELEQNGDLAVMAQQSEINKIEAANPRLFVSGWRPFIGWICGVALSVQMIVGPIVVWISTLAGHPVPLVVLDVSLLTTLLVGMLGLSGMRTVEKVNGVANK